MKKKGYGENFENSIIDLVLTSNNLFNQVINMQVFEQRENVLHRVIRNKNGDKKVESDHNNILTELNVDIPPPKLKRKEFYNLKNKNGQKIFKNITSNTRMLSSVFNSNEPLEILTNRFLKKLDGCIAKPFKK